MYKDKFKIFEFGVSSGNNATYLAKKIGSITNNYTYIATEHPSSIETAKQTTIEQLQESGVNLNHFQFIPQTFENFKPLEEKADLIVASHCLAFCQKDKFYEFMQNITSSVKDGGVFMGELYLDKMGPRFMLNQSSAIQLLQGKIDSNGKYVHPQAMKNKSVFSGFDVKAQVTPNGQMVHFVATKTNCQGTTFEQTESLVNYADKSVSDISDKYSQISKSAEAKEHRGDWVNYAQIYKGLPARPLVHSIFESEQGQTWLDNRVYQNNMGLKQADEQTTITHSEGAGKKLDNTTTEQNTSSYDNIHSQSTASENSTDERDLTTHSTKLDNPQDPNIVNPESWSVHFNSETDKLPQGDKYGRIYEDLPPSARAELESVMPKSLYPMHEEDMAPVQTLKPTTTDTTDFTGE